MKRLICLVLLAAACGGTEQGDQQAPAQAVTDTASSDTMPRDTALADLAMPEAPPAARGELSMRSNGTVALDGEWEARAGRCAEPPMMQILVQQQLDGVILLLALPSNGTVVGHYPVTLVEEGPPEGPAAQAAVQRIIEGRPYGWQARDGEVEIVAFDNDRVSGRYALTVRNINTNEPSRIAGSFLGVPTITLAREQCVDTTAAGS